MIKPRVLFLPIAAVIIAGLCIYRLNRPDPVPTAESRLPRKLAPKFELYDQNSENVRLERYLGRHRVLVVFFDGAAGAESIPEIQKLVTLQDRLEASDIIVIGVSRGLPQEHERSLKALLPNGRAASSRLMLVSDLDGQTHLRWGLPDRLQNGEARVFSVDRAGQVDFQETHPAPVEQLDDELTRLLGGL